MSEGTAAHVVKRSATELRSFPYSGLVGVYRPFLWADAGDQVELQLLFGYCLQEESPVSIPMSVDAQ